VLNIGLIFDDDVVTCTCGVMQWLDTGVFFLFRLRVFDIGVMNISFVSDIEILGEYIPDFEFESFRNVFDGIAVFGIGEGKIISVVSS
jgi:hypothetical protein